jgi:membrane protease YdiL (CAAX protease family)
MDLTPAGAVFLFLVTVFLPFAAVRSALRVRAPGGTPTRTQHLVSVFVTQAMGLFVALMAATYEEVDLFPPPNLGWKNLAMAVAFLAPSLGTLPLRWSWRSREEKRRMMWMLPNRTSDLSWWLLVSLVAGVVEEIVYRGVMLQLWERVLGSWWPAVAICAVAFALAHWVQGPRTVAIIVLLAVGNHLVVRASGDLYTAMAIHVTYDLLAGVVLLSLARRDGVTASARAPDPSASERSSGASEP